VGLGRLGAAGLGVGFGGAVGFGGVVPLSVVMDRVVVCVIRVAFVVFGHQRLWAGSSARLRAGSRECGRGRASSARGKDERYPKGAGVSSKRCRSGGGRCVARKKERGDVTEWRGVRMRSIRMGG